MSQFSIKNLIKALVEDKTTELNTTTLNRNFRAIGECIVVKKADLTYTLYFKELTTFGFIGKQYSIIIECISTKEKNSYEFEYPLPKAEYDSCMIMWKQEFKSREVEDHLKRKEFFTKELTGFLASYNV